MDLETALGGISVVGALAIIGALVFAESAFLFGVFLPGGDTLLLASGVLAAQGHLPLGWLIVVIVVGASLGDNVGYTIGKKAGPRVFKQEEGVLFRRDYAERAADFYRKHGGKTVIIARFIAYVRTFVPLVAGIAHMPRLKFIFYNVFGALFWTLAVVLAGYWLGREFAQQIERYIVPVTAVVLVLLLSPGAYYLLRSKPMRLWTQARIQQIKRGLRR